MRRIIVLTFVTLDGVMRLRGPEEDPSGDPLFGRKTCEISAADAARDRIGSRLLNMAT